MTTFQKQTQRNTKIIIISDELKADLSNAFLLLLINPILPFNSHALSSKVYEKCISGFLFQRVERLPEGRFFACAILACSYKICGCALGVYYGTDPKPI